MIAPEEKRNVLSGPAPGERPGGVGTVDVVARSLGQADLVLQRAREVMVVVDEHSSPPWPDVGEWRQLLPKWFVDACAPERSREEMDEWLAWWRTLPPDRKAQAKDQLGWTVADWLFWMQPSERQWFWWDAHVESPELLRVVVEVPAWPAPLGALEWLLRAAGVSEVHQEPAGSLTSPR